MWAKFDENTFLIPIISLSIWISKSWASECKFHIQLVLVAFEKALLFKPALDQSLTLLVDHHMVAEQEQGHYQVNEAYLVFMNLYFICVQLIKEL